MRALVHIGRYLPVLGIGIVALALIPSDHAKQDGRGTPSFAVVAPELVKQIDAALGNSQIGGQAIGAEPKTGAATFADTDPNQIATPQSASTQQALASSVAVTPSAEAMLPTAQTRLATVGTTPVNVRAGPSKETQALLVLQPGAAIKVAEADGNWVRIVMPDGQSGWVYSRYIAGLPATTPARAGETDVTTVATAEPVAKVEESRTAHFGESAVARASPSSSAEKLFVIKSGAKVTVAETQGNWVHVITEDGISGWVQVRGL